MTTLGCVFTGNIYGDPSLIETAPKQEGELVFFTIRTRATPKQVQDEYDKRGLVPAHPLALAAHEERTREHENVATQWSSDGWCYAAFSRGDYEQSVGVGCRDWDWHAYWSFAGVRKSSELSPSEQSSDTLPLVLVINGVQYRRV